MTASKTPHHEYVGSTWKGEKRAPFEQIKVVSFRSTTSVILGFAATTILSLSVSLLEHLVAPNSRPFMLVAMAAKTESDYESDEEFEERTSDELSRYYFGNAENEYRDAVVQLLYELSRKRFDRVLKIMETMETLDQLANSNILTQLTISHAGHIVGAPGPDQDRLLFMFNQFGDRLPPSANAVWTWDAARYEDGDRIDFLRKHIGDTIVQRYVDCFHLDSGEMCCQFMKATLRGDFEEVESCLAAMLNSNGGFTSLCKHFGETFLTAAAECGHLHIVNAILDGWGKRLVSPVVGRRRNIAQDLLWVAFRDGHFEMAVRVLLEGDISRYPKMGREKRFVRPEVFMCTAEFLRKVLRVIVEHLEKTRQKINDEWFKRVLVQAIKLRRRRHVETLLDEIDPSRLRREVHFIDHPDFMEAVLRSRSASILRCVLIRYPETAIGNAECDPAVVIKKYHWPTGARLLVEAGVKCKDGVPPEHAGILTLSLEDRCRIVARLCIKSPRSENVKKLPLPGKAKIRLLYEWP